MKLAIYMKLWRVKHENTAWHTALQESDEFEVPGWEDLKGAISASRRVVVFSLHCYESSPGMMDVGGLFFDFGANRDAPRRWQSRRVHDEPAHHVRDF